MLFSNIQVPMLVRVCGSRDSSFSGLIHKESKMTTIGDDGEITTSIHMYITFTTDKSGACTGINYICTYINTCI